MIDFPIRGITETLNLDKVWSKEASQPATRSQEALDLAATPKAIHEAGLISPQLREELPSGIRKKIVSHAITARHHDRTPMTTYTMFFSRVACNKPLAALFADKAPISMAWLSGITGRLAQTLPLVPGHLQDVPAATLLGDHQVTDKAEGALQNRVKFAIAPAEKMLPYNRNLQNRLLQLPENGHEGIAQYLQLIGLQPQIEGQMSLIPYWEHEAKLYGNSNLTALQLDLPTESSDTLPKQIMRNILEAASRETASADAANYFFARLERQDLRPRQIELLAVDKTGVVQHKVREDGSVAPIKTWSQDSNGEVIPYTGAEPIQVEAFIDKSKRIMSMYSIDQG